jgi:hypothetical protein
MRRLSLTLIASCGIALLSACNGGGYAFTGTNGNNSISAVAFQNGSGQANDFFVAPLGSTPLQINAVAYKGTGQLSLVVPDIKFKWEVGFAPPGSTYPKGQNGVQTACGEPASGTVPLYYSLLFQNNGTGPVPTPIASPLPVTPVAPASGETSPQFIGYALAAPGYAASTIYVAPALDPTKIPAVVPIGFAEGSTNYCLQVDAIYNGSTAGSVIVVVSNSP